MLAGTTLDVAVRRLDAAELPARSALEGCVDAMTERKLNADESPTTELLRAAFGDAEGELGAIDSLRVDALDRRTVVDNERGPEEDDLPTETVLTSTATDVEGKVDEDDMSTMGELT